MQHFQMCVLESTRIFFNKIYGDVMQIKANLAQVSALKNATSNLYNFLSKSVITQLFSVIKFI